MGGEPYEILPADFQAQLDDQAARAAKMLCAWCAGTFGQPTREMELGQPSPPQYLCPDHQARWDEIVAVRVPLLRKELFHIPAGQGVMAGIPRTLSVSGAAAVALGLTEDPMFKVAREEVERERLQDDLDRQRWEILRDAATAAIRSGAEGLRPQEEYVGHRRIIEQYVEAKLRDELERDVDRVYGDGESFAIRHEVVMSANGEAAFPGPTPVPDGNKSPCVVEKCKSGTVGSSYPDAGCAVGSGRSSRRDACWAFRVTADPEDAGPYPPEEV